MAYSRFKLGDIIKMTYGAQYSCSHPHNTQTPSFKYIVIDIGKYPGYVKTYCIKGPKRWLGNVYNFNESTVEIAE